MLNSLEKPLFTNELIDVIKEVVGKKLIVDESVKGLIPLLDLKKEVTDAK